MEPVNYLFKVAYSTSIIISSIIISIFLLVLSVHLITKSFKTDGKSKAIQLGVGSLIFISATITFSISPKNYLINDRELIINKRIGKVIVPLKDIVEIKIVTTELNNSVRTFGVSGLFGHFGRFEAPEIGAFNMYSGDFSNNILIVTGDKKYIISPVNREQFIKTFEKKVENSRKPIKL